MEISAILGGAHHVVFNQPLSIEGWQYTAIQNPAHRQPVRHDFPCVLTVGGGKHSAFRVDWLLETVDRQLQRQDQQLSKIDHITVAYPHKAATVWKTHEMTAYAQKFAADLRSAMPDVNWITADGLCETRHLNRSGKGQGMLRTLQDRHCFDFIPREQKTDLPFMRADRSGPSYFILLDDVFEQGTTAASMINFIHHNNGHVLAAASMAKPCGMSAFHLRQYGEDPKYAFRNADYNKGAIPKIAEALSTYVRKFIANEEPRGEWEFPTRSLDEIEINIEEYIQDLDQALHGVGLSLPALTMGECDRLIHYFKVSSAPYDQFIADLTQKSPLLGALKAELRRWAL